MRLLAGKKRKKYAALAALLILAVARIHRQQAGLSSFLLSSSQDRYFVYVMGTSGLCSQIMNSMAQAGKMWMVARTNELQ